MPEQVGGGAVDVNTGYLSNALEDMVSGSIGPEQADVRVNVCEYKPFDYAGKMANDPVIVGHMNLTPLDGSNEGKDFDVEWTVGPKASEFEIMADGGYLRPLGSRMTLAPTSNWASLLKAMVDCAFNTATLNGPRGIREIETMEMTIRRIKQTEKDGLSSKNDKGQDKTFYTCLKISKMPGEKGKGGARPATARAVAPAQATTTAPAARTAAPTSAQASKAGTDALDYPTLAAELLKIVMGENGNSIALEEVPRLVFKKAKDSGHTAKPATEISTITKSEDFLYEQAGENSWTIVDGKITA